VPYDREARTHEERSYFGFISKRRPQRKGKRKKKGIGLRKQREGINRERPKPKTTANTHRRTKWGKKTGDTKKPGGETEKNLGK